MYLDILVKLHWLAALLLFTFFWGDQKVAMTTWGKQPKITREVFERLEPVSWCVVADCQRILAIHLL